MLRKKFLSSLTLGLILVVSSFSMVAMPLTADAAEKPIHLKVAWWNPTRLPPPLTWDPFHTDFNEWCDTIEKAGNSRYYKTSVRKKNGGRNSGDPNQKGNGGFNSD